MTGSDIFSVIISIAMFAASLGDFLFIRKVIRENGEIPPVILSGNPFLKAFTSLLAGMWLFIMGVKNIGASPLPKILQILSGLSAAADGIFGLYITIKYCRRGK